MKRVQAYRNIAKSLDKRRQLIDVLQIIHLAWDYQQTQFRQLAALGKQTDAALNLLIIASG